jgi:hypothetical protein
MDDRKQIEEFVKIYNRTPKEERHAALAQKIRQAQLRHKQESKNLPKKSMG